MRDGTAALWKIPDLTDLELFRAKTIKYTYARHMHEAFSIGIIEDGVGGYYYRGANRVCPSGSIVLMNPGEVHTGYSANGTALSYRMLYVGEAAVQQVASELAHKGTPSFPESVVRNNKLTARIHSFHLAAEDPQDRLGLEIRLRGIISSLLFAYASVHTAAHPSGKEHRAIALIKDFLQDNYADRIVLDDLAELTNLNGSYLIRVFRKNVGMPPYTYLTQVRIERAKLLLADGEPLAEVALAVGFADQSHLTRLFKRIVGVTPGRFAESQYHSR